MSVHRRGDKWQVRYRDPVTGAQKSGGVFDRKGDAELVDGELRRIRQLGPELSHLVLGQGTTLDDFVCGEFRNHLSGLARETRRHYATNMRLHLQEIAGVPLRQLTVPRLNAHRTFLLENGRSEITVRDAFARLSGILQVAVECGEIPANPVRSMRATRVAPKEEVSPLSPEQLEDLLDAFVVPGRVGQARMVVLLAGYLGLRPIEVRLARWDKLDLRVGKLTISRAGTKRTAAKTRVIEIPAALVPELRAWHLESGRPADGEIIGRLARNPKNREVVLKELTPTAAEVLGRSDVTLYTLRHTHASLLHYCGFTIMAAARRMGHTAKVHLDYYAHVIENLEGAPPYRDLDALIAAARARQISAADSRVPREFPG